MMRNDWHQFKLILSDALCLASLDKPPEVQETTAIIEKQIPHPLLGWIKVPDQWPGRFLGIIGRDPSVFQVQLVTC
jgi:hypothetical protein